MVGNNYMTIQDWGSGLLCWPRDLPLWLPTLTGWSPYCFLLDPLLFFICFWSPKDYVETWQSFSRLHPVGGLLSLVSTSFCYDPVTGGFLELILQGAETEMQPGSFSSLHFLTPRCQLWVRIVSLFVCFVWDRFPCISISPSAYF